ncbi:hypothetical protein VNO77_34968 [Canavalia gladiata]|uniref:Uncharacterized protein n=1 Tax=Canavalia gladiata TaxID=3824 RepID=A0AAN9KFN7_CANGL
MGHSVPSFAGPNSFALIILQTPIDVEASYMVLLLRRCCGRSLARDGRPLYLSVLAPVRIQLLVGKEQGEQKGIVGSKTMPIHGRGPLLCCSEKRSHLGTATAIISPDKLWELSNRISRTFILLDLIGWDRAQNRGRRPYMSKKWEDSTNLNIGEYDFLSTLAARSRRLRVRRFFLRERIHEELDGDAVLRAYPSRPQNSRKKRVSEKNPPNFA